MTTSEPDRSGARRPAASAFETISRHLTGELGDSGIARQLARFVCEDTLSWRPPTIEPRRIRTILAFTFGNRMQPNGNRTPGPVNEAIAAVTVRLAHATGAIIYAQWEVAAAVGDAVPPDRLVAIYPDRDDRAEPRYLGTSDTIRRMLTFAGDSALLGPVGIVGFRDHVWRCVANARSLGLDAHLPDGYDMPAEYDTQSGQPWCRDRLAYLMHDIAIRAAERREALAAAATRGDAVR
jgi:hypothetical protein